MPLSDHLELMQRLCAKAGQNHECPFEKHFRSGIMSLKEFSTDYDAIVDEHNPFYQEFTKYLKQDALETDDLFSLFECLVIFSACARWHVPALSSASGSRACWTILNHAVSGRHVTIRS